MPKPKKGDSPGGAWIFRDIPRDFMKKAKIAAAIEGTSIKALVLRSLDEHLQEMLPPQIFMRRFRLDIPLLRGAG